MSEPEGRTAPSIEDIARVIDLRGIREIELYATVRAEKDTGEKDGSIQVDFLIQQPEELDQFSVVVTTTARNDNVLLRVVHELKYGLEAPVGLEEESLRQELLNRMVIFHVTPYIREALQSLEGV
ncbi:hypothetical protein [Ornithinimicrobium sp. INDO-MA30-4]|uniref:hypothetical protein n=1 Tax=Ornithinimicrobium sp. INDO-MA30-4 TaxID=2908651 RepID=UPI001F441B55|nr:hypothetical protein [Ornithinimicrobium sp. INDO-MA30-4]UJH69599.1 hypothetical protein L0A91_09535 [Ornithinimicrobium sp. INDO-MA30-4]